MLKSQVVESTSLTIIELGSSRSIGQIQLPKGQRLLVKDQFNGYANCVFQHDGTPFALYLKVSPLDKFVEVTEDEAK